MEKVPIDPVEKRENKIFSIDRLLLRDNSNENDKEKLDAKIEKNCEKYNMQKIIKPFPIKSILTGIIVKKCIKVIQFKNKLNLNKL